MPETGVARKDVSVIDGNVTRLPPIGGRPCFGNPIAWIVHGTAPAKWARGRLVPTRCGRCKAREGCGKVSEDRLNVQQDVAQAAGSFRSAGGKEALNSPEPQNARRALGQLIQALENHVPFTSINDDYADAWCDVERERIRNASCERKRRQRDQDARKQLRQHKVPKLLQNRLEREAVFRRIRYSQYRDSGFAPKAVTVDPTAENQKFTTDVWLSLETLRIMKAKQTAYSIASHLIAVGKHYGLDHSVLRDRVLKALRRINLLETTPFPNSAEKVWPRFDANVALAEELLTPYDELNELAD